MAPTKEIVLQELAKIESPDGGGNLVKFNLIQDLMVKDGRVIFSIVVPAEIADQLEPLRKNAEEAVAKIPGVEKVMAILTAEKKRGQNSTPKQNRAPDQGGSSQKSGIADVKNVIAVASGKGGVGKSTTAVNIAAALKNSGYRVGILDADIYGPSIPRLLGTSGKPESEGKIMIPKEVFGMKMMSIGLLVDEETPMVWRGPMVISALNQMMRDVRWGELDYLVADMPPGTGDVQLSMAQHVPLAGAVIVSTPQDLALIDARKGIAMFKKVEVPILGIVENMSTFICPSCGEETAIFGTAGAQKEASRLNTPFLGAVPLHLDIRENSDAGTPITFKDPDGYYASIYGAIADKIVSGIEDARANLEAKAPTIVIEE